MTRNRDDLSGSFETEDSGGWLTRFLADEDELDRRAMWRLGSWAVGSIAAVVVAILATQSSTQTKRDQVAAADLARQAQLIQRVAKETQVETNRLASAIDTLNGDRDRLYSRLGSLEQNLDSVTGSIAQQKVQPPVADKPAVTSTPQPETSAKTAMPAAPLIAPAESKPVAMTPVDPKPAAVVESKPAATAIDAKPVAAAPIEPKSVSAAKPAAAESSEVPKNKPVPEQTVATATAPAPLMPPKSIMAPPDPAASKLAPVLSATTRAAMTATDPEPEDSEPDPPAVPVQRTEFGIDLGGANSVDGLRTLWQRLLKSNKVLAALRPIIMVKEKPAGTHLRLVAGPLTDAATAAKFCAILSGGDRFCETSVFDGQRLATGGPAAPSKPARKRNGPQRATSAPEPVPEPPPKPASLTSFLGIR